MSNKLTDIQFLPDKELRRSLKDPESVSMSEPIPEKGHACTPTKFNFKNQPITKLLPSFAREFFKSANFQL